MKASLIGIIGLLTLAACSEPSEPARTVADIQAGRNIAEAECSGCHALDGRGMTQEIPNLAAQPADYLVDAMNAYKDGRRHHAALREMISGMSEADIRNIAGYFASLPALELVPESPSMTDVYAEGGEIAAICVDCHGPEGYSTTPGVPSLAGQQPAYLMVATQEYVDGSRGHAEKEAMLRGLGQVDIEKMAMYFASQKPQAREAPPFGDPRSGEPLTASCGGCHGSRGISREPLVPSLAGQEPHYLVNAIKAYRDHDRKHDEMMTDRTDQEVEDIAAYYSIQIAEAAAEPKTPVKELAAKCDRCHGPAVGTPSIVVPSLNGQKREYLVNVMKAYRDEDRGSSMMHKMSSNYSDEMIEAIASYYSSHSTD